jgi:hypothetical protein
MKTIKRIGLAIGIVALAGVLSLIQGTGPGERDGHVEHGQLYRAEHHRRE